MKYGLPPLNGLHAFEVAARHENFARAAVELNLSQAAVSHRVRALEKYLGYALFERLPRGLKLTEAGKAYLPSIQKSFEQIFASTAGVFGHRGQGTLTIRAPISYASLWLGPLIDDFLCQYPGIDLRLISSLWAEDAAALEIDLDFRLGYGNWSNCRVEPILRESVLPVCSPAYHAEAGRAIDGAASLAGFPLIHVMGLEDLWMKYLARAGAAIVARRNDVRVDSVLSALQIVLHGKRLALLQKRFVTPLLEAGLLVAPLDDEMEIEQAIYLVQPLDETSVKPESILFREWLATRLA